MIIVFILSTLTIFAYAGERDTAEKRLKHYEQMIINIQYIRESRANKTEQSEIDYLASMNADFEAEKIAVECEQAYIKDTSKTLETATAACNKPDSNIEVKGFGTKEAIASYNAVVRLINIQILVKKKELQKAKTEYDKLSEYMSENLKVKNIKDTFQSTLAAMQVRVDTLNMLAAAFKKSGKSKESKSFQNLAKLYQDELTTGFKAQTEHFEANARVAAKISMEEYRKEKAAKEKAEQEEAQRKAELAAASNSGGDEDIPAGSCTCYKTNQVWVSDYSAQGAVKGRRGHYEFKQVKVACPCK